MTQWRSGAVAQWVIVLAASIGAVVFQMTVGAWMAIGSWAPDALVLGVLYVALRRGTRAAWLTGLACGYLAAAAGAVPPWGLMAAYGGVGLVCGALRRLLYAEQPLIQALMGGCGACLAGLLTLPRPIEADQLSVWRAMIQMLLPVTLYTAAVAPIGYAWLQRMTRK